MDTANSVSGLQPLGSNLLRRSSVAFNGVEGGTRGGESPPSGHAHAVGQTQAVVPVAKGERSGFAENGGHPEKEQVSNAVKNMNDFLQMIRRTLEFSMDEDSGRVVVQIKDAETDQVIRQIPPENMLKLAKELDKLNGLLFHEKA
jgi:flagellar protein FlaG